MLNEEKNIDLELETNTKYNTIAKEEGEERDENNLGQNDLNNFNKMTDIINDIPLIDKIIDKSGYCSYNLFITGINKIIIIIKFLQLQLLLFNT